MLEAIVIGAGEMGRRHAQAWMAEVGAANVGVVARHQADRERIDRWGLGRLQIVPARDAAEQGWCKPGAWASVCVPTNAHAPVALPLLRAGMHVIVEKPLAGSIADGQALVDAIGGRCFVAHTCRAEAPAMALLPEVEVAAVTRITLARSESFRPLPEGTPELAWWGRLLDVLIHDLAVVVELLPTQPLQRCSATWSAQTRALHATVAWPSVELVCTQLQGAVDSSRQVRIDAGDRGWGWALSPGQREAWRGRCESKQHVDTRWHDATGAVVAMARKAVQSDQASPLDAPVGLRVMHLAAQILGSVADAPFGGPFDWDFVR